MRSSSVFLLADTMEKDVYKRQVQEECGVRFEDDIGSAFFCRVFGHITQQRSFLEDGGTSVSYTHLDVYKRQKFVSSRLLDNSAVDAFVQHF